MKFVSPTSIHNFDILLPTFDVALLRDVHVGLYFSLLEKAKVAELFGCVRTDRQSQVISGESDLYFQIEWSRLQQ